MGGRKGGRKGSKKGGKGGKGKGKGGKASGPRRLKRSDDVSLSDDEASDHMIIEDDESIDDELAFGEDDKDLKEMFGNLSTKKEPISKGKGKGKGNKTQQSNPDLPEERIYASDEDVDESDYTSSGDEAGEVNLSDLLDSDMKLSKRKTKTAKVIETKAESNFESSSLRTIDVPSLSELVGSTVDTASGKRLGKKMKKLAEKDHLLISTPEEAATTAAREREITKEGVTADLQKWNASIRHNRAKEFTSYPLPEPDAIPKPSTATMQDDSKPMTEMEKEIDSLLKSTGLREEQKELDSSAFVKLSSDVFGLAGEDATDDRSAMAKLKSVLSYEHEKKARVKKIKSKTYRRMVRKEKEKEKDKRLELLAIVDPEAALKKKKEEMLKQRAKERLNMRHKNKSQWIKHVKSMAKFDPETRAALQNQNAIHQKLMMKMDEEAENANYNNDGGSDSESTKSDEANEQEIDTLLTAEGSKSALWNLRKKIEDTSSNKKLKGVAGMKFMQRNKEKEKEALLREVDQLEADVDRYREGLEPIGENNEEINTNSDSDSETDAPKKQKKKPVRPAGKITFSGSEDTGKDFYTNTGAAAVTDDLEGEEVDEPKRTTKKKKKPSSKKSSSTKVDDVVELAVDTKDIASTVKSEKKKRSKIRSAITEQDEERMAAKKKRVTFSEDLDVQEAEAQVEKRPKIDTSEDSSAIKKKKKREKAGILEDDDGDMTMSQDYLIERAFAGDGIAEEFQKEKDADIDKDIVGIDESDALPGWGEWGGEDEKLNAKSTARKNALLEERKKKVEAARKKRKDAKLKNVIINENEDTLDPKYRLSKVPFPYRSPGHFVATLETPVGPDWNTETRTRKHIQGNMKTKSGTIITPIEKEQGTRKAPKMKRRKIGKKAASGDTSD
eukprot:TRINITY_DN844_c1_g1_i1.p1 TRINITY_DN844_c1_g1~~TRINITY_DN844_c1_g1_i1.p1  ORF type:complete len:898 (+),score=301.75 TRINITY_DN844_c1_g1_i1:46-2739(+)